MSIRAYMPMALAPTVDPKVRSELLKVDTWLRQLSVEMARVVSLPQGTPAAQGSIDLSNLPYLYLPGRPGGQHAVGNVTFDVNGNINNISTAINGFNLQSYSSLGGNLIRDVITFQIEATGFASQPFVQQWIFPALSGTNGEQMIFADTSHTQTINRKIMGENCTYALNPGNTQFYDSANAAKEWRMALTNLTATLTTYLPNTTGSKMLVIMNSNLAAPYPAGSILYGDSTGTFMSALANGSAGNLLQSGGGTAAPSWIAPGSITGVDHGSLAGLTDDDHPQYLLLAGRTNGQKIGTATQNGNSDDIAISGRVTIGTAAFTSNQMLTVSQPITALLGTINQARITPSVTASGAATGTYRALLCQVTGGSSITSGSPSFVGALLQVTPLLTSATSITECVGLDMASTCQMTNTLGSIGLICGLRGSARGGSSNIGDTFVNTNIEGIRALVSGGTGKTQALYGLALYMDQTNKSFGYTTRTVGINLDLFGDTIGTSWGSSVYTCTGSAGVFVLGTFTSAGSVHVGQYVTGTNIPAGTYVTATNPGANTVTLNNAPTGAVASVTVWGTTLYWSGIYRQFALPIGGEVVNARFLDLQADIPSQHYGYLYLRPTTPGNYPAPTAYLHIGAGTATANTAPVKFDAGTLLTAAEAGAMEYDGSSLYHTAGDAVRGLVTTRRGAVNATAQTAAIGSTLLYAPPAAGYYAVYYTIECTTADAAAGTIQFQVNHTDDIGATTQTGAALALTATGRDRGVFQVYSASGNINYQTNLGGIIGTSQYALRVRLVYLG